VNRMTDESNTAVEPRALGDHLHMSVSRAGMENASRAGRENAYRRGNREHTAVAGMENGTRRGRRSAAVADIGLGLEADIDPDTGSVAGDMIDLEEDTAGLEGDIAGLEGDIAAPGGIAGPAEDTGYEAGGNFRHLPRSMLGWTCLRMAMRLRVQIEGLEVVRGSRGTQSFYSFVGCEGRFEVLSSALLLCLRRNKEAGGLNVTQGRWNEGDALRRRLSLFQLIGGAFQVRGLQRPRLAHNS